MGTALHYNPDCPDCVRRANLTARMDWLRRVELRTDDSPLGKVPAGEIVVVDKRSDRTYAGIQATRKACLQIPLFFFYGVVLCLLPGRKAVGVGEGKARRPASDMVKRHRPSHR